VFRRLIAAARGEAAWPEEYRSRAERDPELRAGMERAERLGQGRRGPAEILMLINLIWQLIRLFRKPK
jgi:hypothetical protein